MTHQNPQGKQESSLMNLKTTLSSTNTLTLIGRITNPSAQKVGALIPFFTDMWKTEIRPIGADLGQGMF